jgi:hypothetical protein
MAFKKRNDYYEEKSKAAREVPFLSEMTDEDFSVVVNLSWPVTQIYKSEKGLLIVTAMFKTFVFRKSALYEKIMNDVVKAIDSNTTIDSIATYVNKNKTVIYGEDDTFLQIWNCKERNYYATLVSVNGEQTDQSEEEVPF